MTPNLTAVQRFSRLRASVAQSLFLRRQPADAEQRRHAEAVATNVSGPAEAESRRVTDGASTAPSPQASLADKWQSGVEAFRRGELPPSDPDVSEGWYWAENAVAVSKRGC